MDSETALARIQRLERMLSVTFFLAIIPWFVLGALAVKFSGPRIELSKPIAAPGLEIVKEDGTAAARLGVEGEAGYLAMHSREGSAFATLGQHPGLGGALSLVSATGAGLVWLGADRDGGGSLTLRNKANETVIVVGDNEGRGGGLAARRGDNRLIAFVGAGTNDVGALQLNDERGRGLVFLGQDESDRGSLLKMRGVNDGSLAVLQVEDRGGELALYDKDAALRALLSTKNDGAEQLELFSRSGDPVCLIGECKPDRGGVVHTYTPGNRIAFSAGVDCRAGAGIISLHHPSGQQIFAAGMSDDGVGGTINVHDLGGKTILRVP